MSKSIRRLGRGLDALISTTSPEETVTSATTPSVPSTGRRLTEPAPPAELPVEQLHPNPYQPRANINDAAIQSLAQSIRRSGILQPIAVRRHGDRFEIIAGERRWAAAKLCGMMFVPVILRDANDEQMLELALIENLQREDLNAIDRAKAYQRFCDSFGLKPDEVASRLGEDRSTVVNYLRLLDLPDPIKRLVAEDGISMGHARCLLGVPDDQRRWQLTEAIVQNDLSVRALEEIVRREKPRRGENAAESKRDIPMLSPHIADMERRFEQALGTKVSIRQGRRKDRGRIVIDYFSLDDFDRIVERLGIEPE